MKTLLRILLLTATLFVSAQNIDNRKYIEVTGSAEMTVQPDEIELEITLGDNGKVGKLDEVEADFKAVLKKHNIKSESVKFQSASDWYWWYWWNDNYRRNQQTVRVKLDNKTDILKFVQDLDRKWAHNIQIINTTHKQMAQFRKDVKIEAIKAAKIKAQYLTEAVGEKLGGVLAIDELPEVQENRYWFRNNGQNSMSNSVISQDSGAEAIDNAKALKLRYEIKVKFAVQ